MPTRAISSDDKFTSAPAAPGWTAEYAVPLGGVGHLLLATYEQAAIGIAHLTLAEEWISVNQRFCEITGYSREEIMR
ncbi:MAG TPA: PAS domain S-box protein, partial [Gemmatimonadaceae bacterium]|nr:PAS domain S-box protein [Gemmatimonadaceae bacterium]